MSDAINGTGQTPPAATPKSVLSPASTPLAPLTHTVTSSATDWKKRLPTSVKGPIFTGLAIIGLFVGGFGLWGATVPISGAAVASGIVAVSGLNQKIDHLEGGIILQILVSEGQRVRQGEDMILLDPTRVQAERDRVRSQLISLQAKLLRTKAERDGDRELVFPEDLLNLAQERGLGEDISQQKREFENRLERHQTELSVLDQRTQSTREEIEGLEIQLEFRTNQTRCDP